MLRKKMQLFICELNTRQESNIGTGMKNLEYSFLIKNKLKKKV